jgi:hypothetical protein
MPLRALWRTPNPETSLPRASGNTAASSPTSNAFSRRGRVRAVSTDDLAKFRETWKLAPGLGKEKTGATEDFLPIRSRTQMDKGKRRLAAQAVHGEAASPRFPSATVKSRIF